VEGGERQLKVLAVAAPY